MKRSMPRLISNCLAVVAIALFAGSVFAQGHGNGHGGGNNGGGSPPPPIQYRITWVNNIWGADQDYRINAYRINDLGVVVGKATNLQSGGSTAYRFFYDSQNQSWVTEDLNAIGGDWIDLGNLESPNGWTATLAYGINTHGTIVGTASHNAYADRVFVLRFPVGLPPEFTLLPRFGSGQNVGIAINDDEVVVATPRDGLHGIAYTPWTEPAYQPVEFAADFYYGDINNSGVIVSYDGSSANASRVDPNVEGGTYSYSGAEVKYFPNYGFSRVNESGRICGTRRQEGKGRNKIDGGPVRVDIAANGTITNEKLLAVGGPPADRADGINDEGDVFYTLGGTSYLYTDTHGSLSIDDLIVGDTPEDEAAWLNSGIWPWDMNNINATGFGQLCGYANGYVDRAFVLTPEIPPGN